MKSLFIILLACICFTKNYSQTFTENAFFVCKTNVDTSESMDILKTCNYTFDRLLIGSPSDSSILFYNILCQTKMAYLSLQTDPSNTISYIGKTKAQLFYLDTNFRFGIETKLIKTFQDIIALKAIKGEGKALATLEKEVELLYLSNKQSARANLVYAFYFYSFKKTQKSKMVEGLLKTSIALFTKEEVLKLPINWGKNLAKNLLMKLKLKSS